MQNPNVIDKVSIYSKVFIWRVVGIGFTYRYVHSPAAVIDSSINKCEFEQPRRRDDRYRTRFHLQVRYPVPVFTQDELGKCKTSTASYIYIYRPIELFLVPTSVPQLVTKAVVCAILSVRMVPNKDHLMLLGMKNP